MTTHSRYQPGQPLIFLLVIFVYTVKSAVYCNNSESCYGDTYDTTDIFCNGYRGCEDSSLTYSNEVFCGGYFGCKDATLTRTSGSDNYVSTTGCKGYESCINATITAEELICNGKASCDNIYSSNVKGTVYCNGYESCKSSYMSVKGTSSSSNTRYIYINGDKAGKDAYLRLQGTGYTYYIYVYGYYGFENGIIYSGQNNEVRVRFYGYRSGYNAKLYCKKNTKCRIVCYGSNACTGFSQICTAQANCQARKFRYPDDSDSPTLRPTPEPTTPQPSPAGPSPTRKPVTASPTMMPTVTPSMLSMTPTLSPTLGICLIQPWRCYSKQARKLLASTSSPTLAPTTDNICDDYEECAYNTYTDETNMYCYGDKSCIDSTITTSDNIECYGYKSCQNTNIDTSELLCYGYETCADATVEADDLICDGEYGCQNAQISSVENLYCNGGYGCDGIQVTSISGDIEFNGNYGGNQVQIKFDDDDSTHHVYVGGFRGLQNGVIYSGENNILNVTYTGYYAGDGSTFVCEQDSTCYIKCLDYGCEGATVECNYGSNCGMQFATCDNAHNTCPNFGSTTIESNQIKQELGAVNQEIAIKKGFSTKSIQNQQFTSNVNMRIVSLVAILAIFSICGVIHGCRNKDAEYQSIN